MEGNRSRGEERKERRREIEATAASIVGFSIWSLVLLLSSFFRLSSPVLPLVEATEEVAVELLKLLLSEVLPAGI